LSRDTHLLIWSLMSNKENKKSSLCEVSSFLLLTNVKALLAGEIQVINETGKDLTIQIEAQEVMRETKYTKSIPAQYESTLMVSREELGGSKLYSITSVTDSFAEGSTCHNLDLDKKYKFVFKNDNVGTICLAYPID
jgi:hypothetical protein